MRKASNYLFMDIRIVGIELIMKKLWPSEEFRVLGKNPSMWGVHGEYARCTRARTLMWGVPWRTPSIVSSLITILRSHTLGV